MFSKLINVFRRTPVGSLPEPSRQQEEDAKRRARLAAKTKALHERGGATSAMKGAARSAMEPVVDVWAALAPERKKSVAFHPDVVTEPLRRIVSEGSTGDAGVGELKGILKAPKTPQAKSEPWYRWPVRRSRKGVAADAAFTRHRSV